MSDLIGNLFSHHGSIVIRLSLYLDFYVFDGYSVFQHHVTDLEARLALKDAEAADLRQRLARNGTVVSDVNGGYYGVKTY